MTIEAILELAKIYGTHRGVTLSTVSTYAANDGKLFRRFADEGANCTLRRASALIQYFSDNWPADLVWPRHIPRPKPSKKEAA